MPYRLRRYPVPPPATQDAQKILERPSAQDIYEQVANNARQELGRSSVSLAISGLAGGIFMGLSALGNAIAIALLTAPGTVPSHTIFFVGKMFYPLGFIVVILGRSLNLNAIVYRQGATLWFFIPQFVGFCIFFLCAIAETSRPPFDLPEADTELVAGYHTEYSGMRWGLFQTAEYINMIVLSGLAVSLFFDGWHFPFVSSLDSLGPIWFVAKLGIFVFVFIWLRASLPRLRYDQLMRFGWKVLLPIATINALVTALIVVWVG